MEPVKIATVRYVASCPLLMAQANGFFASEGVAVAIGFQPNGRAALEEALEGRADLVTVADLPIALAAAAGRPVAVVATLASTEDHGLVARRDHGVGSAGDLKGKRIGISVGSTSEFYLSAFLNRLQLSPTDVEVVDQTPSELRDAIAAGSLDAVVLYQPFLAATLEALGPQVVAFNPEGIYYLSWNLAGARAYVDAHGEAIQKVLRASIRGAQACKDAPDAAREVLAKAIELDNRILRDIWPLYRFDVSLRQSLLLTLEDEARWAGRNGLAGRPPNYLDHLSLQPLQAVAPSSVTVFH